MNKYKMTLNEDHQIYVAMDVNESGIKDYSGMEIEQLLDIIENEDAHLYEIIKEDKSRKMYIDFDSTHGKIEHLLGFKEDDFSEKIVSVIEGVVEDFVEEFNLISEEPIINVLTATNKVKYSFHFTVENIVLQNQEDSSIFHKKFLNFICGEAYQEENDFKLLKFIDNAVYTKNRLFRLYNQSKKGKGRPLVVYKGDNIINHLVSYTEREPIKIPKSWKKRKIIYYKPDVKKIEDLSNEEEIRLLLENTLHKTVEYQDWMYWVWSAMSCGVNEEDIHYYSKEGCIEKYDYACCDKIIKEYDETKGNWNKSSLVKWASESGFDIERDVEFKQPEISQKKLEHLTWIHILKKYSNKVYKTDDVIDIIEDIRLDVSQVISNIQNKFVLVYQNDELPFDIQNTCPHLQMKMISTKDGTHKLQTKNIELNKLLND